jgi:chemotaxis protein methyltransferase CheR
MDRFLTALRPGALLLLGYSESLFKVYDRFEMVEMEGAFVYRRPEKPLPPRAPTSSPKSMTLAALPPARPSATSTLARPRETTSTPAASAASNVVIPATEALHKAAEAPATRKTRKSREVPAVKPERPSKGRGVPTVAPAQSRKSSAAPAVDGEPDARSSELPAWSLMLAPGERLNAAVRMIERGDFVSAVATVEQLLVDEPNHLDALLTVGNLYSLTGRTSDARDAFAQAINREPLCVEARVFGGLAALQAGELPEARSELGKALFLEPSLAIGHYLLAQVHERLNDNEAARRSYRNAIAQLRFPQRPLAGHYPELPDSADAISRAARYALAALEEA